jgi:hypothetical protein
MTTGHTGYPEPKSPEEPQVTHLAGPAAPRVNFLGRALIAGYRRRTACQSPGTVED